LKDILRKNPESSKETADEVSETGNDVPNTSISQIQTGDQALPNMDDFIIEESVPQDDIEISDNACLHGTHPPLEESQEISDEYANKAKKAKLYSNIEMELKLSKLKVKSLQAKIRRIEKNEEQLMAILGEKEKRAPMITSATQTYWEDTCTEEEFNTTNETIEPGTSDPTWEPICDEDDYLMDRPQEPLLEDEEMLTPQKNEEEYMDFGDDDADNEQNVNL
ncbi:hypothetical protein QZH41_020700, partial [Actinostola sp. cb2023]